MLNEITDFNLDNLNKRIIMGDSAGNVVLLNMLNGAKLLNLPNH